MGTDREKGRRRKGRGGEAGGKRAVHTMNQGIKGSLVIKLFIISMKSIEAMKSMKMSSMKTMEGMPYK